MNLKELMQNDDCKYIAISDFIELIANHTNDHPDVVIEYLSRYTDLGGDFDIYLKYSFSGYLNEWMLGDLITNTRNDVVTIYTFEDLKGIEDFCIAFFLKADVFNAKHIKSLNLKTDNDKLQATDSHKINVPTTRVVLGEYQKLLITYSLFTPRQIACLIADCNPAYHHNDDFYNARLNMVENAIEAKQLTLINDKEQIAAEEAQLWLIKCGLIYEGFNDGLRYDTLETYQAEHSKQQLIVAETSKEINQELTAANAKIKALESELKKANAALADKPADDLKDVPHQSYRTVARIMYAMAQLATTADSLKLDNSKPYSQNNPSLNAAITTILQNDGVPLEHEAVGKWLSRINEIKSLK